MTQLTVYADATALIDLARIDRLVEEAEAPPPLLLPLHLVVGEAEIISAGPVRRPRVLWPVAFCQVRICLESWNML